MRECFPELSEVVFYGFACVFDENVRRWVR